MNIKLFLVVILIVSAIGNVYQAVQYSQDKVATQVGHQLLVAVVEQKKLLSQTPPDQLAKVEQYLGQQWVSSVRSATVPSLAKRAGGA